MERWKRRRRTQIVPVALVLGILAIIALVGGIF